MLFQRIFLLCALVVAAVCAGASRGYNDKIEWYSDLAEAQTAAASSNKPMLILIHKTWCGACKNLKKTVSTSEQMVTLAKEYIMVNLEDDEEPKDKQFQPDGGYVPRLFFADSAGKVNPEMKAIGGNPKYGYFYSSASLIEKSMAEYKDKFAVAAAAVHDEI